MTNSNKLNAWKKGIFERTHQEDFRTPQYIIHFLKSKYGSKFYDACYNQNFDNCLSKPYIPKLTIPNKDEWVYFNPPFHSDKIHYFIDLAQELKKNGITSIFLLPNKLCQVGFVNKINLHFNEIIFLGGRINFISKYSVKGGTSRNGCFIGIILPNKSEFQSFTSINLSELKKNFKNKN